MSIKIEDGTGLGYSAQVDSNNRLQTASVTDTQLANKSHIGKSFVIYATHQVQVNATAEAILLLDNSSASHNIHIETITFSTSSASLSFDMYFDAAYTSGGSDIVKLNLNRGSGLTSDASGKHSPGNDLVISSVDSKKFFTCYLSTGGEPTYTFSWHGGLIINPSSTIGVRVTGTATDEAKMIISYYEEID